MKELSPFTLHQGDALAVYAEWPAPAAIISDGPYGVRGFHGDLVDVSGLADWYGPHVAAWSAAAHPATTLWFWNTELGWASVHPLLVANGWEYVQLITWDKGLGHIAGNVNSKTIRTFPVVTEVCAFYRRRPTGPDGSTPMKEWLRSEWQRAGLPLREANSACGVKDAATRKYLTQDWMWYWPPGETFERLANYANRHGRETGWPYFSLDGNSVADAKLWDSWRYRWTHQHGLTNVWQRGPLRDHERHKGTLRRAAPRVHKPSKQSSAHLNQKPSNSWNELFEPPLSRAT